MAGLRMQLRGSRALAGAVLCAHLASGACLMALVPGFAGPALALLLAALGWSSAWDRALLRGRRSFRALRLCPEGLAVLELADGRELTRRVAPRRYVGRWCVALPFADTRGRGLLVVRGMLDPAEFRCLRLWALWGRMPAVRGVRL